MTVRTPEIFGQTHRPVGPLETAWGWLSAILEQNDLGAAWPATDPNLRLVLVQGWIWANRSAPPVSGFNRDELARALAGSSCDHPLWSRFAARQLGRLQSWWGNPDLDTWGASTRSRLMPSDYELVLFAPLGDDVELVREPPARGDARLVLLHGVDGRWLVAGFSKRPPSPGWPPTV